MGPTVSTIRRGSTARTRARIQSPAEQPFAAASPILLGQKDWFAATPEGRPPFKSSIAATKLGRPPAHDRGAVVSHGLGLLHKSSALTEQRSALSTMRRDIRMMAPPYASVTRAKPKEEPRELEPTCHRNDGAKRQTVKPRQEARLQIEDALDADNALLYSSAPIEEPAHVRDSWQHSDIIAREDDHRAGPGCLDSAPRILSGSLPGFAERGAFRFCRGVGRA